MTLTRNNVVATTEIMGAQTDGNGGVTYPTVASPAAPKGIGPAYSLAVDNTLGAFSPHQGRIYVTYVDRYNISPRRRGDVHGAEHRHFPEVLRRRRHELAIRQHLQQPFEPQ